MSEFSAPPLPPDERYLRVTIHEAGHAVAAVLLGRKVSLLRATENGRGDDGAVVWAKSDAAPYDGSPVFLPATVRNALEADIMITLAGTAAQLAYTLPPAAAEYFQDADERDAEWMLRGRLELSEEAAEYAHADDDGAYPYVSDDEFVWGWASKAATDAAGAYIAWLRAETRLFVSSDRFRRALDALVPVLLERGELDGGKVHAIVEAATTNPLTTEGAVA